MNLKSKAKKIIKQIAFWTLPPGFQNIFRSIRNSLISDNVLSPEEYAAIKQNRELKNIHQGNRCFILATGPSINDQNLKLLKNEFCIAVSNFYLHPDFRLIDPQYYCIAPWHPPHNIENYLQLLKEIGDISKKCSFFLGINEYARVTQNNILLDHDVYYHNTSAIKLDKDVDLCLPVLPPMSVTIMALQSAIFMGFSEIYLLGCDHDSILNYSGKFANQHFYPEEKAKLITDISTLFKGELLNYIRLWNQYEMLNTIAQSKNIKILNATKRSLLDVFDKVDYDSLFLVKGKLY
ncbi:MAG: hypothetical protein H9534_22095 [Dolichospermum circinale Clear-D4]|nr:hypothetical protein [Dolichospermum circinale Clear-D4]